MAQPTSPEKKLVWKEKIRQQQESGISIEKWCHQNQIAPHRFHYWRSRLFPKPLLTRSCFTELPSNGKTGVIIEYRGFRVHVDKCFDPSTLKSCLLTLEEIKC